MPQARGQKHDTGGKHQLATTHGGSRELAFRTIAMRQTRGSLLLFGRSRRTRESLTKPSTHLMHPASGPVNDSGSEVNPWMKLEIARVGSPLSCQRASAAGPLQTPPSPLLGPVEPQTEVSAVAKGEPPFLNERRMSKDWGLSNLRGSRFAAG